MVLDFQSPLSLLAFIPIGGLMVFIYLKYKERKLYKGIRPLVTRLIILLLVLLALAGAQLNTLVKDTELIFVADLSDSMEGKREELIDFISQAMDILPDNYKTGVIGFARDAQVEQALSDSRSFYDFHVGIKASYTNIEAALQRAEALFSPNSRKRIIVLTDGNENTGDGMMRAKALMQRGIRVDGVLFETQPTREVQLSDLVLPSSIYQGESYGVRVVIDSSIETNGSLKLFANRNLVGQQRVELQKGTNVFLFEELAEQSGTLIYEAEIETGEDTILQRSEEHTSELQSRPHLVCRPLLEKKKTDASSAATFSECTQPYCPPPNVVHRPYTKLHPMAPALRSDPTFPIPLSSGAQFVSRLRP